jgi:hypothetical protein
MHLLMTAFSVILHVFITYFILYIPVAIMIHCQEIIIIFYVTIKMDDSVVSNAHVQQYRRIIVKQTTEVVWTK